VRGYAEALVIAYLVVTFVFTTVGVVGSSMVRSTRPASNPDTEVWPCPKRAE